MSDVSEIVRQCISETLAEELNTLESTADTISNVIASDPRLLRLSPDSPEEITATVEIVDDITKQAQLSSFNINDPDQVRKRIVANLEASLLENLRQSSMNEYSHCTSASTSTSTGSEKDTKTSTFTFYFDELGDDTISPPRSDAGAGPVIPDTHSTLVGSHSPYIYQYIDEFQNHKSSFEAYLKHAKQSDDLNGARVFRKALNERLEAERAVWMLVAHQQAADLKSWYRKMKYWRDEDQQSPFDNRISLEASDDTIHLTIDMTQFQPEQQDEWNISFSDTPSFEWSTIEKTLSVVWDCFDDDPFQSSRDTIIDNPEFPVVTSSSESNYEFVKPIADASVLNLEPEGRLENISYDAFHINTESPNLRFANGQTAFCGKDGLNKYGVYQAPDSLDLLALYPEENTEGARLFLDDLVRKLNEYGAEPTSLKQESFSLGKGSGYPQVGQTASGSDYVITVMPNKGRVTEKDGIDDSYSEFKKQLVQQKIPLQMVKLSSLGDETYLENIAAGVVAKAGGIPWRVDKIPGDADIFTGLDVTHDQETGQHLGASANIVLSDGTIFASKSVSLRQDEAFQVDDIARILKNLIQVYVKEEGHRPNHIVVHRDGEYNLDCNDIVERIEEASDFIPKFDLVEIQKSGNLRIGEFTGGSFEVAEKGVGFVSQNGKHAYLETTEKPEFKPGNSIGTSRPIRVVKRHGPTDLETLTQQVYWLSEAHIASINQSTRLPITTYYADQCADHVGKDYPLEGELIRGAPYV